MSTLRDILFCDKCQQSINKKTGGVRHDDKQYHKACWKAMQPKFPFKKALVACVLALVCVFGYQRDSYTQGRIDTNEQKIELVAEYVQGLEYRLRNTFVRLGEWATTVETRLNKLDKKYAEQVLSIERMIEETKKEVTAIVTQQRDLIVDLKKGQMTDKQAAAVITQMKHRAEVLEAKIQHLLHNPDELINKVIKPTVGIGLNDTKGQRLRGSGVLFKRVKNKDGSYTYYGMTAYHVWDAIFKYQEKVKNGTLRDKNGNLIPGDPMQPKLVIYVYNGRTQTSMTIIQASWTHPTGARHGKYLPSADFAVFTFKSKLKLHVAELASDEEIKAFKKYGSPVLTVGISPASAPGVWTGTVANPETKNNSGTMCHAYGYYGQSGGPTFCAKTLKVMGINQRINIHPVLGGMDFSPDTNVLFITTIDIYRKIFNGEKKNGGKDVKDLLN